ncbi:MAG: NAD-dependent epimerase/dehydratase family protein [Thioalkalivibrionaceae bacterium]
MLAITGAAGHLGRVLLGRLLSPSPLRSPYERATRIRTFDLAALPSRVVLDEPPRLAASGSRRTQTRSVRPPSQAISLDTSTIDHRRLDLAEVSPASFEGCTALVHLAFALMGNTPNHQRDPDGGAARAAATSTRVLRAAVESGVKNIVLLSSAAVYGPWPDTPVPIPHDHPVAPRFPYAQAKHVTEQNLMAIVREHRDVRAIILRPPVILGRHAHPLLRRMAQTRLWIGDRGAPSRIHLIWETDAADAILAALTTLGAPRVDSISRTTARINAFAIGAAEVWDRAQLAAAARAATGDWSAKRITLRIPSRWANRAHSILSQRWPGGARYWGDPGWTEALDGELVLDIQSVCAALQWQPAWTVADMLDVLRSS